MGSARTNHAVTICGIMFERIDELVVVTMPSGHSRTIAVHEFKVALAALLARPKPKAKGET